MNKGTIPLGGLDAERLALKSRLSSQMRWECTASGQHYILLDVVCLPLSMTPENGNKWAILYAPSADTAPVPFVRPIDDFMARFKPVVPTPTAELDKDPNA